MMQTWILNTKLQIPAGTHLYLLFWVTVATRSSWNLVPNMSDSADSSLWPES